MVGINKIILIGAGQGNLTRLEYGMDEIDWRAAAGAAGQFIAGWWEGKVGAVDFPATTCSEIAWITEGRIALTDLDGNRIEFAAGQGYLLPEGFAGRWETIEDAKKLYVMLEPTLPLYESDGERP